MLNFPLPMAKRCDVISAFSVIRDVKAAVVQKGIV